MQFRAVIYQGANQFATTTFDSTGDAVQAVVDLFSLNESQHQALWDELSINLPNNIRAEVQCDE